LIRLNPTRNFPIMRLLFFLFFIVATGIRAQSPHEALRTGDRLYENQDFEAAEQAYRQAGPGAKARYNEGNAVYRQGRYADAAALYRAAAETAKAPAARADALYNLGNACLKQRQYDQAIGAYEQALRLRPGDPAAKSNLQLAKQMQKQAAAPPPAAMPDRQAGNPNPQSPDSDAPAPNPDPQSPARLIETAIGAEDQRNAKKYREMRNPPPRARNEKDW
jgi:tetratricopeptide (TPR) repeat protein